VTQDPAEFANTVFPYLQRDPVLHSVLLSSVRDRISGVQSDSVPPVLVSVHDAAGAVVGAAMRTDGRGVFLGGLDDDLVPEVAEACADRVPGADGVEGTASAARRFAELWTARFGNRCRLVRGSRLHRLGRLVEQHADGTARRAATADLDVVARWYTAFGEAVGMPTSPAVGQEWARTRIASGRVWLWEVGGAPVSPVSPVSMVGHQETVFASTRIGPVYTPDRDRGHGYASALTAHVTRLLLEGGSAVCLYTDLANPTSNKIYAAIGYEPVADFVRYEFS